MFDPRLLRWTGRVLHARCILPLVCRLLGRDLDQQQQLDLAATNLLAMAWHPYQEVLAASDGAHQVVIYSLAGLASASSIPGSLTEATATLAHAHQQQVRTARSSPSTPYPNMCGIWSQHVAGSGRSFDALTGKLSSMGGNMAMVSLPLPPDSCRCAVVPHAT